MPDDDDVYRLWVGSMRRAFDDAVERGYLDAMCDAEKLVRALESIDPGQRTEAQAKLFAHTQMQLAKGRVERDRRSGAEAILFDWLDKLVEISEGNITEADIQRMFEHVGRREKLYARPPEVGPARSKELNARRATSEKGSIAGPDADERSQSHSGSNAMADSGELADEEDLPLLEVLIALRDLSIPRGLLAEALKIIRLDRDVRVASGEPEAVRDAEECVRQLEAIAPADRTKVEELTLAWQRILLDERTNGPPTGGWERLEEFEYRVQSICGPEEQGLLLVLSAATDERPLWPRNPEADPPKIQEEQIGELAERRAASEAGGENWELEYGLSRLFQRTLNEIAELQDIPAAERTTEHQERIEWLNTFLKPPEHL